MKKRFLISIAFVAVVVLTAMAQTKSVPYSSDLYSDAVLENGWLASNIGARGSQGWGYYSDNDNLALPDGHTGGATKPYDSNYAADAWLISPEVSLKAGTTYTVGIWAKTLSTQYNEKENFEITLAQGATASAQKTGKVILSKPDFQSSKVWVELTAEFTVDTDGDYNFGLHCYSIADQYKLDITGFSVTGGDGGDGGDQPVPTALDLPYASDFSTTDGFTEWSSLQGAAATSVQAWTHNDYNGSAEFSAENFVEDCWFISPALNFANEGNYLITLQYTAFGDFDLAVGTDPSNPNTFTVVKSVEDATDFDEIIEASTTVNVSGIYYVAIHARAASGSYMGYRVNSVKVKEDVSTPAIVTDLTAVADADGELKVVLTWTNPDKDNAGADLDNITKVEIYRNDELIETIETAVVGSPDSYTDEVPQAGSYKYKVLVYGNNGVNDAEPMIADAGYVGIPLVAFPYSLDITTAADDDLNMWTVADANNDGSTWNVCETGWYVKTKVWRSERDADQEANDYLAMPYMDLDAGYYRLTYMVSARSNSYEVGYATSRADLPGTFVKCAEVIDEQAYSNNERYAIIAIPVAGRYCFAWHHIGTAVSGYNYVELTKVEVVSQVLLPDVAADVKVTAAADNSLSATVAWTNPSKDNAGQPLESLSYALIYRDGQEIGRTSDVLVPGESATYVDSSVPAAGEYVYTVEIYNENGCAEADASQATAFVGPGKAIPYTAGFEDWRLISVDSEFYAWERDTDGSLMINVPIWGDADDYALSPYIELENDTDYLVTVTVQNDGDTQVTWNLVAGTSYAPEEQAVLSSFTLENAENKTYEANLTTKSNDTVAAAGDDVCAVAAGKLVTGIYMNQTGSIHVNAFSVVKKGSSGIPTTVAASSDGITFASGVIYFVAEADDVKVCEISGRVLYSAAKAISVSTYGMPRGPIVVSAVVNGKPVVLKIVL